MPEYYTSESLGDARQLARRIDAAAGLPRAGVHVGTGRHVPMPSAFDPESANPGWAVTAHRILRVGVRYVVVPDASVAPPTEAALFEGLSVRRDSVELAAATVTENGVERVVESPVWEAFE